MRLGAVWIPCSNAYYRVVEPLRAMERRGHEVVWPDGSAGTADPARLAGCDVVHVYRRSDDATRRALRQLAGGGTGIVYDNDDDLAAVPPESPAYGEVGGRTGQRLFATSVEAARSADAFTTTTESLAERYRSAGVDRIEVIPNHVAGDVPRPRGRHDGVVIGWVGGIDHIADVRRIPVAQALQRLLDERDDVRVECIGVDLELSGRYRHDSLVAFEQLPDRIGGWDLGIAPLADLPCNRARSDIKLKEYAASGVPWLASPIGPYVGLGEEQGGRVVPDDGWWEALARLVTDPETRARLGRNAERWAALHTLDAAADRWERVFLGTVHGGAAKPVAAGVPKAIRLGSGGVVRMPAPAGPAVRIRPRRRAR